MLETLLIIEIVVLLVIFYQDIKYRAVSWIAFLVLAGAGFLISYLSTGLSATLINSLLNATIVFIQLGFVYLFYYIKTGKRPRIINSKLGLGDLLMFFALALMFSPVAFLLFIFLSFLVSLLITLLKNDKQTIPLAGYQALLYLVFIILSYFVMDFNQFQFDLNTL